MSQLGNIDQKWTNEVSRTGVGQSTPMKIPAFIAHISALLIPGGNSAEVQYTCDDESAIDGATAVWVSWEPGVVTANTIRTATGTVTGLRINQTVGAGASRLQIAGQRWLP